MRAKYYHFLLLIFSPILLLGQDYVPFTLEDGVTWQDFSFQGAGDPPGSEGGETTAYSYRLDGDTLVNGIQYKKVYSREDWYYSRRTYYIGNDMFETSITEENYDNPYILYGGLRQDTAARTVYYINFRPEEFEVLERCLLTMPEVGEEELLYEFPVSVGDVVQTGEGPIELIEIRTTTLEDGTERRTYYFNNQTEWVEGIGSADLGLLGAWLDAPFESGCGFLCYSEAEETLLQGEWSLGAPYMLNATCNALILSADEPLEMGNVRVIPNPVRDQFRLSLPDEVQRLPIELDVFNSVGQLVLQELDYNSNSFIDTKTWARGIYFLMLKEEEQEVLRIKVMKVGE
ncbi:MAG: T9SS type A sorting domain-containing protein [Bacteroidota bacterium]